MLWTALWHSLECFTPLIRIIKIDAAPYIPRPDPKIFERGVDLAAVINSITNLFFTNKII